MKTLFFALCIFLILGLIPALGAVQAQIAPVSERADTTIKEAISKALQTNAELMSFSRNVDIASENVDLARANERPSLSLNGDITHARADNNITDEWSGETGKSISLSIEQPLYRGGQTESEIKEQLRLKASTDSQFHSLVQETIINVVDAYMETYQAVQALEVNRENVSLLQEQLKATEARFEAGELTRTDTSQAQARLAEAQAALARSRAVYQAALAGLREVSGLADFGDMIYPDMPRDVLPSSLDEALKLGLLNNPAIKAADENLKAQNYNIKQQEGALFPQVTAGAAIGYDRSPAFSQFESQKTATLSVNATLPLYQSGAIRNRIRQSKILKYQARDDLEAAKRAVTSRIISAWEEYEAVSSQIAAREAQLAASKVAYEGVRLEEEVGARSVLDVLDANQDVRDAELALINTKRDRVNAYYRLLGAIGLLGESFWDNSQRKL